MIHQYQYVDQNPPNGDLECVLELVQIHLWRGVDDDACDVCGVYKNG